MDLSASGLAIQLAHPLTTNHTERYFIILLKRIFVACVAGNEQLQYKCDVTEVCTYYSDFKISSQNNYEKRLKRGITMTKR